MARYPNSDPCSIILHDAAYAPNNTACPNMNQLGACLFAYYVRCGREAGISARWRGVGGRAYGTAGTGRCVCVELIAPCAVPGL